MDWDQLYRDGVMPWEKGAPSPPLSDWIERHPGLLDGRILVPGCGLGHDAREIGKHHPNSLVIGLDLSPQALELAAAGPEVANVTYLEDDLFRLPGSELAGGFDWIFEHTCYCAIEMSLRVAYVEAVHALLKPGGQFLGVFFLDPYDEEHLPGGGPPHGTTEEEVIDQFVGSGRFEVVETYIPEVSYPGRERREWVGWLAKSSRAYQSVG